MISACQIKMARAMLDWSQEDLAQACRLSPNTIYNLEKGFVSPRKLTTVRAALENRGVEFLGTGGVNRRAEEHKTFAGPDSCEKFYDDLLAELQGDNRNVYAIFETQETMLKILGADSSKDFTRLEQLGKYAQFQCLLSNIGHLALSLASFEFRLSQNRMNTPMSVFIYGSNLALILNNGEDFHIFVVTSASATYGWRESFQQNWKLAAPTAIQGETKRRSAINEEKAERAF